MRSAADNFNRADENPLSGGGAWVTAFGELPMQVVGNACTPTNVGSTDNGSRYVAIVNCAPAQYSRAKLSVSGGTGSQGVCLKVRMAPGALSFYRLTVNHDTTNNISLQRFVAGTVTMLSGWPVTQAWTDGDVWELQMVGPRLRVYRNGTQVGSDTIDANVTAGEPGHGISTTITSATIEDWEGGELAEDPRVLEPARLFVARPPVWSKVQSFVQTAQLDSNTHANTQVTLGSAVAVGDVLCLLTTVGAQGVSTPTAAFHDRVTDSLGNNYVRKRQADSVADGQGASIWVCHVTVAGTPTITYTPDDVSQQWIGIWGDHFTGSDKDSNVRSSFLNVQLTPGTGANAITSTAVGTQPGDLMWGAALCIELHTTIAIGSGFTAGVAVTTGGLTEYRTDPASSQAATFTDATNGGADHYFAGVLVITPATPRLQVPWQPHHLEGWGE